MGAFGNLLSSPRFYVLAPATLLLALLPDAAALCCMRLLAPTPSDLALERSRLHASRVHALSAAGLPDASAGQPKWVSAEAVAATSAARDSKRSSSGASGAGGAASLRVDSWTSVHSLGTPHSRPEPTTVALSPLARDAAAK